jgi:N-acetylmuramic acid 6-phosphate etherase
LRILADLAGVERKQGLQLLVEANGSVKVALLMVAAQLPALEARGLLMATNGNLRHALEKNGYRLK